MDAPDGRLYFSARPAAASGVRPLSAVADVPHFLLYGEASGPADPGFLHLETVAARSRVHDWTIRPHAHDDLLQVLFVSAGGGRMLLPSGARAFRAPAAIAVPPGAVHGFAFSPGTEGHVLTIAAARAESLAAGDPDLAAALSRPACADLPDGPEAAELASAASALAAELDGAEPARGRAADAHALRMLVAAARAAGRAAGRTAPPPDAPSRDAALAARFRAMVERRFREHLPVGAYAARLGVSERRLNAACRRTAGASALAVVHARLLEEAVRALRHGALPVAEVAARLGFRDPAYFSRFVARRAGAPPSALRAGAPPRRP
jgi:AraC family transcriptional activator of pobA